MVLPILVTALLFLACFSVVDAIGVWLLIMILHGPLVDVFGSAAVHLPLQAGLAIALVILVGQKWQRLPFAVVGLVLATLMSMCLSALFGLEVTASIPAVSNYAKGMLLVVLLAMVVRDEKDLKKLTLYLLAGLAAGGAMALYQYATGAFRVNTDTVKRVATLRGDPNDTAMLFVSGLSIAFYWVRNGPRFPVRIVAAASFLLLAAGTVLTGSRGGFLALILVMALIYLKSISLKTTFAGVAVLALLCLAAPGSYWDRVNSIFTGNDLNNGGSLSHRKELQLAGLKLAGDHLGLGVGSGNFGRAFFASRQYARMGVFSTETSVVAHNMYLEFLVENGLISMLLFLAILARTFLSLRRFDLACLPEDGKKAAFPMGYAVAVSLSGMLFSGLFLSQAKNSVLWFLIGIGLAAGLAVRRDTAPDRADVCGVLPPVLPLPRRTRLGARG